MLAECLVDVAQRDVGRIPCENPTAPVARRGRYNTRVAQTGEGAADHDRIGPNTRRKVLRGGGLAGPLSEVQENVKGYREPTAAFHVTQNVTLHRERQALPPGASTEPWARPSAALSRSHERLRDLVLTRVRTGAQSRGTGQGPRTYLDQYTSSCASCSGVHRAEVNTVP